MNKSVNRLERKPAKTNSTPAILQNSRTPYLASANQNTLLQSDQHALPMLHQLLATLTAPDVVSMDNVTPTTFLYTILASQRFPSGPDLKKNYLTLMRLCHPDRHPGINRHISQQLIAVHNVLTDTVTRKIYDCCGVRAVTRKNITHFFQTCNPRPLYEPLDDLQLTTCKSISTHDKMRERTLQRRL